MYTGLRPLCFRLAALFGSLLPGLALGGSVHLKPVPPQDATPKFYERMLAEAREHPHLFAERHHLMARALKDAEFRREMEHRLLEHPARFAYYHPCFARFLAGELTLACKATDPKPGRDPKSSLPVCSLPEPSTATLVLCGMVMLVFCYWFASWQPRIKS